MTSSLPPAPRKVAALQHFRLAEVTVTDQSTVVLHHSFEKEPVPLPIHHVPICISFALFEQARDHNWRLRHIWQYMCLYEHLYIVRCT